MRLPVGTSPAKCARVRVPNAAGHKKQKSKHFFLPFFLSQNEYYCGIEVKFTVKKKMIGVAIVFGILSTVEGTFSRRPFSVQ